MQSKKILLAGLPHTGKTTFIAALWYFVNVKEAIPERSFVLDSLSTGEDKYLNEITSKWLEFSDMPRTNLYNLGGETVVMNLRDIRTNELVTLDIPDFNGETFRNQFEERQWTLEYEDIVDKMEGVILFVSPYDEQNMPSLIYHENAYLRQFGPLEGNPVKPTVWDIEQTPNQVKLVDLLQFWNLHRNDLQPLKVALVVSAWDKVKSSNPHATPEKWTEIHLPLLHQYISCNDESIDVEFFGISAQGGEYFEEEENMGHLIGKPPIERIQVQENKSTTNDIARPILWITS
jgi:hypothetical protein